ncbi:MAG: hypothetical protein HYS27_08275 [Deltaproteobacteria bacterium]|nr:hypothetical protein [Deltaproteobacteria bacterium]
MKLEDLTVNFEEQGVTKVRELDRALLASSSAWATIAFLFEERGPDGDFRGPKVSLRRYRKRGQGFVVEKHLTLGSPRQAHALAVALARWFPEAPGDLDVGD